MRVFGGTSVRNNCHRLPTSITSKAVQSKAVDKQRVAAPRDFGLSRQRDCRNKVQRARGYNYASCRVPLSQDPMRLFASRQWFGGPGGLLLICLRPAYRRFYLPKEVRKEGTACLIHLYGENVDVGGIP